MSVLSWLASAGRAANEATERTHFFEKRIRPVLVEHCYACHAVGAEELQAGLRLDSRAGLLAGGDSGPALVVGDAERSLVIAALEYRPDGVQMPPKGKLPPRVIADFKQWIARGALWGEESAASPAGPRAEFAITDEERAHWAFQPLEFPDPESLSVQGGDANRPWTGHAIDRFVRARQQAAGLAPGLLADKRTQLRRATYGVTGLPPTAAEMSAFLADTSEDAYAKVVDRLLASDAYGEHWARHWFDGVRYVHEVGWYTRHALGGPYRDWVIESFNVDRPYDEFVVYQLAGDLVPSPSGSAKNPWGTVATGVLAMGNFDDQETDKEALYLEVVDDQIDLVSRQFLGLTVSCARCHDHKFDPISTEDYYALAGIFHSSRVLEYARIRAPRIEVEILDAAQTKQYAYQRKERDKLAAWIANPASIPAGGVAKLSDVLAQRTALRRTMLPASGKTLGILEGGCEKGMHAGIGDAHLYIRGNWKNRGAKVPRRFPEILAGASQTPLGEVTTQSGRLELARWLVRPDHPLTPRVMANRVWLYHFGAGLVRTPSNFGMRGEAPTHPELLDYLAQRLIDSGWSLKAPHREILLSATYRQLSHVTTERYAGDVENRLLSRFSRRRLSAEEIYDTLLLHAGQLEEQQRATIGTQSPGGTSSTVPGNRQTHHLAVHGWRAVACRHLRPQAGLGEVPSPGNPHRVAQAHPRQ